MEPGAWATAPTWWDATAAKDYHCSSKSSRNLGCRVLEVDAVHDRRPWTICARNLSRKSRGKTENACRADFRHSSRPVQNTNLLVSGVRYALPAYQDPTPQPNPQHQIKTGHFMCYENRTF